MTIDSQQALTFAKTHPLIVTTALSILSSAVSSDAKIYTDLLDTIGGTMKPAAFAKAHPELLAQLLTVVTKDLGPAGVLQLLSVVGAS